MTIADIVMLTATIIIWSLLIVNILLVIFGYVYYLKTDPDSWGCIFKVHGAYP